jgi:hypothetical protein
VLTVASAMGLLVEYPRMDEVHLTWSACLGLAVGVIVLDRWRGWLSRRWSLSGGVSRGMLLTALLLVPVSMALPNLAVRTDGLRTPSGVARLEAVEGLDGASGVLVSTEQRASLVATVEYVRGAITPGEPIFVYPISPLIYVLTGPNPTRFSHLFPGTATDSEILDIIAVLDHTPVRLVVVSDAALAFIGPAHANQPLEDYLATHYRPAAQYGEYRVLVKP